MKVKKRGVLYLRNIHPDAKRMFKSVAIRRGDTCSEVVEGLIRLYVKNPDVIGKELKEVKESRTK